MKKILILFLIATSMFFTSCKETEGKIYDGSQSLAYFETTSANLPVILDGTGEVVVKVGVSTLSNEDRSIQISIDEQNTNAPNASFSFPNTVVIPANEYTADFTVNGVDAGLSTTPNTIQLKLSSYEGGIVSSEKVSLSIYTICPIPDDFMVGQYLIEQISPLVDGPSLSSGTIVDVLRVDATSRKFSTENYPNYCSGTFMDFSFKLECGKLIVNTMDTTCRCNSVDNWFTAATTPTEYDLSDDSSFELTFTDDSQSDCSSPVQTTYKFTKQ